MSKIKIKFHFDGIRYYVLIYLQWKKKNTKEEGNSHEFPNPIFVNLKSNTIMKKPRYKSTTILPYFPNFFR